MKCFCTGIAIAFVLVCCFVHETQAATRHHHAHMRGANLATEDTPLSAAGHPWSSLLLSDAYLVVGGESSQGVANTSDLRTWANTTQDSAALHHKVVVAKYDEDISWLQSLPKIFDVAVYQSKDPNASHFVENVGNEASKYLSYIVENYDSLPETVAFMQAGRMDWHDPLPKDEMLQKWDWGAAAAQGGLAFLPTAAPCLIEDSDPESVQGEDEETQQQQDRRKSMVPDNQRCPAIVEHVPKQMETVRSVWGSVFESELGPLPKHWLTKCCAQFQVTRGAIQLHPLEFYQHLLRWTMEHDRALLRSDDAGEIRRNHDEARRDSGHVLEPLWVLIFSSPENRPIS